jgi:hypothetical protein
MALRRLFERRLAMPTMEETNRTLADKILAEAKQNPQAYPGKFIGIANGQVVIVSDDIEAVDDRLHEVEPDSTRTYIIDLTLDENEVHEIWGSI